HVRAFEDLLTRPTEDDRALPEVGQGHGACSPQAVGDGEAVGAIGRDVGGVARLGAVEGPPHLRRRGQRADLGPVDEDRDRTEPVAAGDLLVVAVAAPIEVAQAGGKICSCGAHPGMLLDREAAQTPQSACFDPVSTSGSEMTRYFPARARAASM